MDLERETTRGQVNQPGKIFCTDGFRNEHQHPGQHQKDVSKISLRSKVDRDRESILDYAMYSSRWIETISHDHLMFSSLQLQPPEPSQLAKTQAVRIGRKKFCQYCRLVYGYAECSQAGS